MKGMAMRRVRGSVLGLGLVASMTLGTPMALSAVNTSLAKDALRLLVGEAAAQVDTVGDCNFATLCSTSDNDGGDAGDATASGGNGGAGGDGGAGGRGGSGGSANVHDIGNAHADASSSVVIDDITTGDANAHQVNVDARGATRPVVVAVAGSFPDTGVDVFAPGGNAQAGTTGGNGLSTDASGGDGGAGGDGATGGDGTVDARGGAGGDSSGGAGAPTVSSSNNSGTASGTQVIAPVYSIITGP